MRTSYLNGIVVSALSLFATTSYSQVLLEEVVVTAQKREQNISDIGISITAFSGDQLKTLGLTETIQLAAQTPGLYISDFGGGATTIFTIRGSAQLSFDDQHEAPVAVYSDGAYNPYLSGVGFSFFDLDRVEVLRGPQGTLFGRNATGGVVHLLSARPTREFDGYLEATVGEYGQQRFEGAVSGPLTDTVAGRLATAYHRNDGYIENLTGAEDGGQIDNYSGRVQLLFEPNEEMSVRLIGHWSKDDTVGQAYHLEAAAPDANGLMVANPALTQYQNFCQTLGFPPGSPATTGTADCFGTPNDGDLFTVPADNAGFFERDHYGVTAELNWDQGDFQVTNIINWQSLEKDYAEDVDVSPAPIMVFAPSMDSSNWSEEFRLSWDRENVDFMTGFYYLSIENDMLAVSDFDFLAGGFPFDIVNSHSMDTETWAVFLQGEWSFAPQWTLIGGLRWTEDDKDYTYITSCPDQFFAPGNTDCLGAIGVPGGLGIVQEIPFTELSRSEGDWSGAIELDWKPNDEWLVYAKISRGHKAGGFNGGAAAFFTPDQMEYDGEILWSYEGGIKATLFGGTAHINSSIFYYDYNDFQSFDASGISLVVSNLQAENIGAEIEIVTNPWDGWEFLFGISLQDADQNDYTFNGITRDRPMPNAPNVMLNGLGRYEWAGLLGGRMFAQIDFNYVDERSLGAIDHPSTFDDGYVIANTKLGWTSVDQRWDIELWVKNFNDAEYRPWGSQFADFFGGNLFTVAPPRWVGATARYRL